MNPLQIFARKKRDGVPLAMVALSDAPSAQIACEAGIDAVLIGDSLGNTALGYESTVFVTMDAMAHHVGAVVRGVKASSRPNTPVIADMPIGSYASPEKAVENAVRLLQLGAHAVKIEGTQELGFDSYHDVFARLEATGVPVMGHIGFTPQSVLKFESVVQGRTARDAASLLRDAIHLSSAGCFAIVLEAMTEEVAKEITKSIPISTIGIGAGGGCDGQVLVWHDLVGITEKTFKMARAFAPTRQIWTQALQEYKAEVENRTFPAPENGWAMTTEEAENWDKLRAEAAHLDAGFDDADFEDNDPFEDHDVEQLNEQPF